MEIRDCGVEILVDLIGGKWKSKIVYQLREETIRFNELWRRLDGITQRMLTRQLRELESDGLVSRKIYLEVPPKVEYALTDEGAKLLPMLEKMNEIGLTMSLNKSKFRATGGKATAE